MKIHVRLFATLREQAGTDSLSLDLPESADISAAVQALLATTPVLRNHIDRVAYAVNLAYVPQSTTLNDGDELALIPPVSGG